MPAGQVLDVVVCSSVDVGAAAGQISGPTADAACPPGTSAYVVQSYVPYSTSQAYIDGYAQPFDPSIAGSLFAFGFFVVVSMYLVGLKGSVIVRPFFGGRL